MTIEFIADVEIDPNAEFQPELPGRQPTASGTDPEIRSLDEVAPRPISPREVEELRASLEADFQRRLEQARMEMRAAVEQLGREVASERARSEEALAHEAAQLALVVAERLVRDRIDQDPTVVERALRDAIKGIEEAGELEVYAHPTDAAHLRTLGDALETLGVVAVHEDPAQRRGGCRLRRRTEAWDASLISQLTVLRETLDQVLEGK